jgi:hypothetical protein
VLPSVVTFRDLVSFRDRLETGLRCLGLGLEPPGLGLGLGLEPLGLGLGLGLEPPGLGLGLGLEPNVSVSSRS